MVSKRFRQSMIDNQKIWGNVTELVIGFHPDLPKDQYLCHIGHATLELFLRRVPKISKIIININESWAYANMMKDRILPLIDRFAEKLQLKELILCEYEYDDKEVGFLVEKLVNNGAKESLEILHMSTDYILCFDTISMKALIKCSNLKTLKLSIQQWAEALFVQFNQTEFDNEFSRNFILGKFFTKSKLLQVLEITDYVPEFVNLLSSYIYVRELFPVGTEPDFFPVHLQTLRFRNPKVQVMHSDSDRFNITQLKLVLNLQITSSLRELEIEYCAHSDDLSYLPAFLNDGDHLTHFKLIFLPYLEFNKTQKIAQLLENVIHIQDNRCKFPSLSCILMLTEQENYLLFTVCLIHLMCHMVLNMKIYGNSLEEWCVSI